MNSFFFSSRRRHTRCGRDWSSDVCSSDLTYKIILGLVLLFAAWRLAISQSTHAPKTQKPIVLPLALAFGAMIGWLSGLTAVGGGIFLSPLQIGRASCREREEISVVAYVVV